MTSTMNTSRSTMRAILPQLETALKSFQSSSSTFRIVKTINPPSTNNNPPKTLLILDSSFNPPSKAHLALARSALHSSFTKNHPPPFRFLLLFSTQNADKAPSAASFPQRLAFMTLFAEDLLASLQDQPSSSSSSGGGDNNNNYTSPTIDIGLTTAPYYTDKSNAIATEGATTYPNSPTHIHLLGFDTITRIFAAKYYPDFKPPFSALDPYFDAGHRLRVTLRPSEEFGTVEAQRAFIAKLADGEMEADGGKREWAGQIDTVEALEGEGVSSTRVRKAAKNGDWAEVNSLCTPGVAEAVKESGAYEDDARGSKMS